MRPYPNKGFTLIELLVVIAIIGLLSSVVLASLNSARSKAADAKRVSDLREVQKALEIYNSTNNSYPVTPSGWSSQCSGFGGVGSANSVIPGLVPTYISSLPTDANMNTATNQCCYLYYGTANDYKFEEYNCPYANYSNQSLRSLIDPPNPGNAWSVYTTGATNW